MRLALCLALTLASCGIAENTATVPPTSAVESTVTTTAPATTPTTSLECPGEGTFVTGGHAGLFPQVATDAAVLSRIRWQDLSDCERLFIEFATPEGAPATSPPQVSAEFLNEWSVLRVNLGPQIVASAVAEQLIESELVADAFVVRSLNGALFVDVHMTKPVRVRLDVAQAPAQVVIDIKPGGLEPRAQRLRNADVVLVESFASVSYPFTVSGYVRPGQEEIEVSVTSLLDGSARQVSGKLANTGDLWAEFVVEVPDGPSGMVLLTISPGLELELMAA